MRLREPAPGTLAVSSSASPDGLSTHDLPRAVDDIESHWKDAQASRRTRSLAAMRRLARTLSGRTRALGLAHVSESASSLVGALAALGQKSTDSGDRARDIERRIAELRDACTRVLNREDQAPRTRREPTNIAWDASLHVAWTGDDELAVSVREPLASFGYDVAPSSAAIPDAQVICASDPERLDQLSAAQQASSGARRSEPPKIVLSARGDVEMRLAALRAGATGFATLPIEVDMLVDRLDAVTARAGTRPLRVLVLDRTRPARRLGELLQAAGMIASELTDPNAVLHEMHDFQPDAVVIGAQVGGCTGTELANLLRLDDAFAGIPVLIRYSNKHARNDGCVMVDGWISSSSGPEGVVDQIRTRALRARSLRTIMDRDGLTGLLHHTRIKTELETEVARCQRRGAHLSFAMIDIDHFKSINDRFGHSTGDRVIRSLSHMLRHRLRRTDIVGRYGGEEFATCLLDTTARTASQVLDAMRSDFAELEHRHGSGAFTATFSAGIAEYPHVRSSKQLIEAADRALYRAKHAGRNRIVIDESHGGR